MKDNLFSKTGTLTKFVFRRERISLIIWILCLLAITLAVGAAFPSLFDSDAERQAMAETMKGPAMVAMVGPAYGADNYTDGAMMSQMMLLFTAIAVAIMYIFLVIRHTRRDEEEGRVEVIRSLPVGKLANLSGAMIISLIATVILSLLIGFGLAALNIESMNLHGSLLYGAALGALGLFFAGITAVFCQLCGTARGASMFSFAFLGLAYLIKAGEASSETLSYMSPLSLMMKVQAYVNNVWWPVFVLLGIAVISLLVAFFLNKSRDLGEGLIAARSGRKTASRFLRSPFGLATRLSKNTFIAWAIGLILLGMSYGSVLGDFETFLESNDFFKQLLSASGGASMVEQFVTMLMSIMSIIVTVPVLMMILKLRSEEKKGHNEHIIARNVSKLKLLSGYFIISIITSVAMMFFVIVGLWSAAYAVMADPIPFWTIFTSGFVYLPAIWVMLGLTLLLITYLPRLTSIIWFYLGLSIVGVYLGRLINLPDWIAQLCPYGHVPQIPVQDMNTLNLVVLSVIAVITICIGFFGYKRREMIN